MEKTMKAKVKLVVDLQYGSTGKGLIAGYIAEDWKPDVVVTANMPNAGHTYINKNGRKWIHKVLPNGIVSPNLKYVLIGGGAVFSYDRLMDEIKASIDVLNGAIILIHPNAVPLKNSHRAAESQGMMHENIGSTAQGSGAASVEKIMRNPDDVVTASQVFGEDYGITLKEGDHETQVVVATHGYYRQVLAESERVLAEGAQGYSLGLNQMFYPYCTSRECTPARFLSDMGIPLPMLEEVIGVARTYPIRVAGTSGDIYPDQEETSWAELGLEEEFTTVTKKIRRVFTWSDMQMHDAIWECQPDRIFLNFVNYYKVDELVDEVGRINDLVTELGSSIGWLGFGPSESHVVPYDSIIDVKIFADNGR